MPNTMPALCAEPAAVPSPILERLNDQQQRMTPPVRLAHDLAECHSLFSTVVVGLIATGIRNAPSSATGPSLRVPPSAPLPEELPVLLARLLALEGRTRATSFLEATLHSMLSFEIEKIDLAIAQEENKIVSILRTLKSCEISLDHTLDLARNSLSEFESSLDSNVTFEELADTARNMAPHTSSSLATEFTQNSIADLGSDGTKSMLTGNATYPYPDEARLRSSFLYGLQANPEFKKNSASWLMPHEFTTDSRRGALKDDKSIAENSTAQQQPQKNTADDVSRRGSGLPKLRLKNEAAGFELKNEPSEIQDAQDASHQFSASKRKRSTLDAILGESENEEIDEEFFNKVLDLDI